MTTAAPPVRVQLDRYFYNVLDLKEGGMGQVWILERPDGAESSTIYEKRLAVKTFNVEDETGVVNELFAWASLNHNSIVPLIRIARLNFRVAAMMPLKLCSLDDLLAKRGPFPKEDVAKVLLDICEGLQFAHETFSITHLDLKPGNILVHSLNPLRVQVSDWGMARILASSRQVHAGKGSVIPIRADLTDYRGGTLPYMAPERFSGHWRFMPAVDIFSLGMTGVQLLTGILPFIADTDGEAGLVRQLVSGEYFRNAQSLLGTVPRRLSDLCLQCLHPDPNCRPDNYGSITAALQST